jgi:hypothetical protein
VAEHTDVEPVKREEQGGDAPRVIAPSTRVNVALPFGTIQVREPSKELAELVAIVGELVGAVGPLVSSATTDELQDRITALTASLA